MKAKIFIMLTTLIGFQLFVLSQDTVKTKPTLDEVNKEKQNPVGGIKSVFLQDVVLPMDEGNANSFSIQPIFPVRLGRKWKMNTYTIIPFQSIPPLYKGGSSASGLGNILFNGFIRPAEKKKSPFVWGLGPAIQLPTRTDPALGSNRVSLGPALLAYVNGAKTSAGVVAQNFWSLGGEGINKVNLFSTQYIFYHNFPKGWYFESNGTITANWLAEEPDVWTVPIGGGPGKTFQIGKSKYYYSAALQGFYNAAKPEIVGDWMIVAQFQIIFSM